MKDLLIGSVAANFVLLVVIVLMKVKHYYHVQNYIELKNEKAAAEKVKREMRIKIMNLEMELVEYKFVYKKTVEELKKYKPENVKVIEEFMDNLIKERKESEKNKKG